MSPDKASRAGAVEAAAVRRSDLAALRSAAASRGLRTTAEGREAARARVRAALARVRPDASE